MRQLPAKLLAGASAALLTVALTAALPGAAFATYADVTPEYPASQELEVPGDIVYAADIPNGTYHVPAYTTSYMCILSDPNTGERNSCSITVQDGNIVASFYISNAYTAIYFGSAEAAAACTNEEGTDASAYILGNPSEGYTPHYYQITVPALNYPFEVATYNGGTKGFEAGMWYTRQFAIWAGDEVLAAIEAAQQTDDPDPEPEPEPEPDTDSGSTNPANGSNAIGADTIGTNTGANTQAVTTTTNSTTSSTEAADATTETTLVGFLMTITGQNDDVQGESLEEGEADEDKALSAEATMGIAIGALLIVGILWRVLGFRAALKKEID